MHPPNQVANEFEAESLAREIGGRIRALNTIQTDAIRDVRKEYSKRIADADPAEVVNRQKVCVITAKRSNHCTDLTPFFERSSPSQQWRRRGVSCSLSITGT